MEHVTFADRESFRSWLGENVDHQGVWLLFGKPGGPKTLSAGEALEEALCHGWIDGQMQKLDDKRYVKYFAPRTKGSSWSAKNKGLAEKLMEQGKMTPEGLAAVQAAKASGAWDSATGPTKASDEQIEALEQLLNGKEPAASNYKGMSPSVRRSYAGLYFDAKTQEGRARRLEKIVDRLNKNLKPM